MAKYTEIDIAGLEGNEASQPRVFAHSATPITGAKIVTPYSGQQVVTTGTPAKDDTVSTLRRGACLYVGVSCDITVLMESQDPNALIADAITFYGVTAGSFLPVLVTKVYKVTKTGGDLYTAAEVDNRILALF
jgi:hypothetical protein